MNRLLLILDAHLVFVARLLVVELWGDGKEHENSSGSSWKLPQVWLADFQSLRGGLAATACLLHMLIWWRRIRARLLLITSQYLDRLDCLFASLRHTPTLDLV
jgi:hypothetical protein